MKLGVLIEHFGFRGTEVSIANYASMLIDASYEVIFFYQQNCFKERVVFELFSSLGQLIAFDDNQDLKDKMNKYGTNTLYIQTGNKRFDLPDEVDVLMHSVFPMHFGLLKGHRHATISNWLSEYFLENKVPFVPFVVPKMTPDLEAKDFRDKFNIPEDSLVLGSYGGETSFDIRFVYEDVIPRILVKRKDLVFIFMNYPKFIDHERVIFLKGTNDIQFKSNFVNACDMMIHARALGESFGLAIAEFTTLHKPIITFGQSPHKAHIDMLGNQAIIYNSDRELDNILESISKSDLNNFIPPDYSEMFKKDIVLEYFSRAFLSSSDSFDPKMEKQSLYDVAKSYLLLKKNRSVEKSLKKYR